MAQLDFSSEWLGVPGMLLPDMTKEVQKVYRLGVSPSLVSRWREAETANRADSGQLQFWSEPSGILNVRSSSTPDPVAFTIPLYQTW